MNYLINGTLEQGEIMTNKEESLNFLQNCIDTIINASDASDASDEDIKMFQINRIYDIMK